MIYTHHARTQGRIAASLFFWRKDMKPQELMGRIIQHAEMDMEFHQSLIITFSDGTKVKITGWTNHSDEETYLTVEEEE
jgi:hypothetical protein